MNPEELRDNILALTYRHRRTVDEPLPLTAVNNVLKPTEEELAEAIETLTEEGYIESGDGKLWLTEKGWFALDNRERSYCPYI